MSKTTKDLTYNQQRAKNQFWQDEAGIKIPYKRVTKVERLHETLSAKVAKEALAVHKKLTVLNQLVKEATKKAYDAFMVEKGIDPANRKGNFLWYNFDRSIKIEVNVNEPIKFDSLTIEAAKAKFDEYLENNIESKDDFAKAMVLEAFETKNGALDVKKILNITKYADRVSSTVFKEGVKLVNDAIRKPKTKTYRRVWIKDEAGTYQNIELNFSSL